MWGPSSKMCKGLVTLLSQHSPNQTLIHSIVSLIYVLSFCYCFFFFFFCFFSFFSDFYKCGLSELYQIVIIEATQGHYFLKHNILNVYDTYKLNIGVFMHKHHTNQLPSNFSTYFTKHIQAHNYSTRNAQDYL